MKNKITQKRRKISHVEKSPLNDSHVPSPIPPAQPVHVAPAMCAGCAAREEQLVFMREQVRTLQDKLICMVPESAEQYQRLKMTEMANMRSEGSGFVPLNQTSNYDEDSMDEWYRNMTKSSM